MNDAVKIKGDLKALLNYVTAKAFNINIKSWFMYNESQEYFRGLGSDIKADVGIVMQVEEDSKFRFHVQHGNKCKTFVMLLKEVEGDNQNEL